MKSDLQILLRYLQARLDAPATSMTAPFVYYLIQYCYPFSTNGLPERRPKLEQFVADIAECGAYL